MVTTEQGKAMADQYGARFFETSAKTGAGVSEAFTQLAKEIYEQKAGVQVKPAKGSENNNNNNGSKDAGNSNVDLLRSEPAKKKKKKACNI